MGRTVMKWKAKESKRGKGRCLCLIKFIHILLHITFSNEDEDHITSYIHRWAHAYYRASLHTKRCIGAFHVRISCVCVCERLAEALHCVYIQFFKWMMCRICAIAYVSFGQKWQNTLLTHKCESTPFRWCVSIDIALESLLLSMICV